VAKLDGGERGDVVSETVLPELPWEWTFDDLARLPEDGHRYEIVDGGLHVSPPPTPRHQLAASRLGYALTLAAPAELEVVEGVGVHLGKSMLVPDVVVLRSVAVLGRATVVSPADVLLAVEIVSPSSVSMDRLLKPAHYADVRIPSYWRVELDRAAGPAVAVHELEGDHYRETVVVPAGETCEVSRPYRLTLDPARLVGPRI
jgi:Uma2 family endonuclease